MRLKEAITNANTGLDAIKRAPVLDYPTDLRCIRIQDISQAKPYEEWAYTETSKDNYKKFKLAKGDILVARTGATVGVSYYVNKDLEAVYNNGTIRLKINEENDSRYIFYITTTKEFRQYIDNVSCVATQPNLRIENLLRFQCPDKDLEEQKAIASVLSAYDDLIEKNNRKIEILQDMAEELYKEWFVRFRFPGYKTAKFTDGIPNGWEYKPFSEVVTFERGVSYSSDEIDCEDGINLINLKNINSYGGFRLDGTKKYNGKYRDGQVVKCGDLVMGVTDMTQDRRIVGAVALIPHFDNTCVISADLVKLNSDIDNLFIYSLCRYGYYSKFFSQFANGSNVLHLKPSSLRNQKMLIPREDLIDSYVKVVRPINDTVNNLNRENDNLKQQRDLLLPRLMSGKLAVKVS